MAWRAGCHHDIAGVYREKAFGACSDRPELNRGASTSVIRDVSHDIYTRYFNLKRYYNLSCLFCEKFLLNYWEERERF